MLGEGGKLMWPLNLRGPAQQKLDKQLEQAVTQAIAGTLELPLYTSIVSSVLSMQDELLKRFRADKIDSSGFVGGQAFLDSLQSSLRVLQRPDVAKFFDGTYAPRGNNVPDLVEHMTAEGLQFAPANPGADSAYFSLHSSFVSYARAAQSSAPFQSKMAPPPMPLQKALK